MAVQVLPPLPIGAEHALWGSPAMATDGHRFLWAPNEVDEPVAGSGAHDSASALTPAASAAGTGGLARDLSIIDSVDGQASAPGSTAADTEGPAADAALGDVGGGSFGSGSPVRVHAFLLSLPRVPQGACDSIPAVISDSMMPSIRRC